MAALEKNTNSKMDTLLRVTKEGAIAVGVEQGRQIQRDETAVKQPGEI
jgi:hypothetical protein